MIRKKYDYVDDDEFIKIKEPHDKLMDEYIENTMYDFVAYYLAKGYELSALWECNLKNHVSSAVNTLEGTKFLKNFDYKKLKEILLDKYSLEIINDDTSEMKITRD